MATKPGTKVQRSSRARSSAKNRVRNARTRKAATRMKAFWAEQLDVLRGPLEG